MYRHTDSTDFLTECLSFAYFCVSIYILKRSILHSQDQKSP